LHQNNFLTRFKKGSRPFRRVIEKYDSDNLNCRSKTTTKTFFRLILLEIPEENTLEKLYMQWNFTCFLNKTREFIWKFRSNVLGLNTRVSHFNANVFRGCTFCAARRKVPVPDESFIHLFFDCPETRNTIEMFVRNMLPELNMTNDNDKLKKFFFTGINPISGLHDNFFLQAIAILAMFYIWECKLQKRLPTYMGLLNEMFWTGELIRRNSSLFRESMIINLYICRSWQEEAGRRR
jgi:hypothetical protein